MNTTTTTTTITADSFLADVLRSVLPPGNLPDKPTELLAPAPATAAATADDKAARERARQQHFMQLLGLLLSNLDYAKRDTGDGDAEPPPDRQVYFVDKKTFADLLARVNELIALQLNEVFHQPQLRDMEGKWRAISDLVERTNFDANIGISLLDASKDEIAEDMSTNGADIAASDLFKKVYTAEYDQLGGEPYAALIGMYDFTNDYGDRVFLKGMAALSKTSHAPFIASAAPSIFGVDDMSQLMEVRDFSAALDESWMALRGQEEFAYIGLTLPRYIARRPYKQTDSAGGVVRFKEEPPSAEQERSATCGPARPCCSRATWCARSRAPAGASTSAA